MTPSWRVPLTHPAWLVSFCVPDPARNGQNAYASEWFDSEGEARAQIMRLAAIYRRLSYSLRRFEPGESRAGEGTLVEESAQ